MTLVVVSPHRDDAAFSLGLSIALWAAAGHRIVILNCCTRSVYAPFAELDSVHRNDRDSFVSALRLREDQAWIKLLPNRVTVHDLNIKDGPMRLGIPTEEVIGYPPREGDRAVRKIRRALEELRPEALVLPLALGHHVDHVMARDAGLPESATAVSYAFYEELPYAARLPEPANIASEVARFDPTLQPLLVGPAQEDPELAADRKRRMALCYDSQISDATALEIANFSRLYDGRERLWHVPGAWRPL